MDKKYTTYHVIFFIVACLAVLGVVALLNPTGTYKIGNYDFRFISQNKLHKVDTRHKIDLEKIIADVDTTIIESIADIDTITVDTNVAEIGILNFDATNVSDLLVYNSTGKQNLKRFFKELHKANRKKVRILHYGDSQIEGDRITAFFRQRLQSQFGGDGPGFIPAVNTYNTMTYTQTYSENFVRYTNFGGRALENNSNYGIMNSVGRFTPEEIVIEEESNDGDSIISLDSLSTKKEGPIEITKAWVEIKKGNYAYGNSKRFSNVHLHYTDAKSKCKIKVYKNGELYRSDTLMSDGRYHIYKLEFSETPEELRFEFEAESSPNFLGYSLEGNRGVMVDNIAMRGSSGTFFGRINQGLAKRMYEEQNVELFIMQYGGNSMPYIKDSVGAKRVANMFQGQLSTIRRLVPNAAIIVIGPSDMSTLIEGEYTTYPMLPYYVECLKQAAQNVGGAYFDLYQAMGGKDSMLAWVENDLAAKDYIHFSIAGTRIAAQKFYDAFMAAYSEIMKE